VVLDLGHDSVPTAGVTAQVHVTAPGVRDVHLAMATAVADLWAAGLPISWQVWHANHPGRRVYLPTSPCEGHRHWVEPDAVRAGHAEQDGADEDPLTASVRAVLETADHPHPVESVIGLVWADVLGVRRSASKTTSSP
jgi:acyl transferase domain-containing protein